jgi:hypothetical protein
MQIQFNFNWTEYQRIHAGTLALADALGLNWNPAIIWNAIPWSFVVDWVFGVSRWLDQFKVPLLEPVINIHRVLWSVQRERKIFVQNLVGSSDSSSVSLHRPRAQLPVVQQSAYRRDIDYPDSGSITSSGLSLKEFSLGAALVLARRRRRK